MIKRPLVLWLLMDIVMVMSVFIKGKTGGLVTIGICVGVVIILCNLPHKGITYKGHRWEIRVNTYDKVFLIIGIFFMLILGVKSYNLIFNHIHDEDINQTVKITGRIVSYGENTDSVEYIVDVEGHTVQVYDFYENLNANSSEFYKIGDVVTIYGTKKEYKKSTNLGEFNNYNYYKLVKEYCYRINANTIKKEKDGKYTIKNSLVELRKKLLIQTERVFAGSDIGLVKAMVLGDKSDADEKLQELYQDGGIIHLLVISGTHISLLAMYVFDLLKRKLKISLAGTISIGVTIFYVLLTGISFSSLRAVIMISLFILSKTLIRTYDIKSALGFAGLIIINNNPMSVISSGFILSFLAIVAIAYPYEYCIKIVDEDRKRRKKQGEVFEAAGIGKYVNSFRNSIMNSLILSSLINVVTLPVILSCYYKYPPYSVLVNVIVAPFMPYIIVISILAITVSFMWIPMGEFLAGSVHYMLLLYEKVCEFARNLPFTEIKTGKPYLWKIVIFYMLILLVFVFLKRIIAYVRPVYEKSGIILLSMLLLILLGCVFLQRGEKGKDFVQMIDVGQGDAFYLNNSDGVRALIDGGSSSNMNVGERIIEQYLKAINVWELDYVFISHHDIDHINGIVQMIEREEISIKNIIIPYDVSFEESEKEKYDNSIEEYITILEKSGARIHRAKEGMIIDEGSLKMLCLNPSKEIEYKDSNSLSACYYVDNGGTTYLFTGDVCDVGEKVLIDNLLKYNIDKVDYLKVAHHGSKNSTVDDFLKVIKPRTALISCGRDNSYGHPHKEVVDKLERMGCKIVITADMGSYKCE